MGIKIDQIKEKLAQLTGVKALFPEVLDFSKAPPWMDVASKEIGQKEIKGVMHNERIIEYFNSTSLKATSDEVPSCAAFVGWVLNQCGYEGTRSAAAKSYLKFGDSLLWPKVGAIAVIQTQRIIPGQPKPIFGHHVGFVYSEAMGASGKPVVNILGSNQNDSVNITAFKKSSIVTYRWPTKRLANFSKIGF